MWFIRAIAAVALLALVSGCGQQGKFKRYHGPEVTRIEVFKADRVMRLYHHDRVLRTFRIGLGFAPEGHKQVEGDGRTPEGWYVIDRRNPNSNFHLSIGISYPNPDDVARARAMGKSPGGDIFIHGQAGKQNLRGRGRDWTDGCIAVTDREMEDIYAMVRDGTPILIHP